MAMEWKQVFLYDGTQILLKPDMFGNYEYPKEKWTDIKPPQGIYTPFRFDGEKWIGSTKEEWEARQPKIEIPPSEEEELHLEFIKTNIELKKEVAQLNEDVANLVTMLVQKQGGN